MLGLGRVAEREPNSWGSSWLAASEPVSACVQADLSGLSQLEARVQHEIRKGWLRWRVVARAATSAQQLRCRPVHRLQRALSSAGKLKQW